MGILRWLERKLFTGDVIRDYGKLGELPGFRSPGQVSLLLCKRRGRVQLVLRTSTWFELNWYPVEASVELADKLAEAADDVRNVLQSEKFEAIPKRSIQAESTAIFERRDHRPNQR